MDPLAPVFRFGLPVLLVFVIGLMGRTRRIGFWGAFILSIVLTPVGGFLVTLFSGAKPIESPKTRKKSAIARDRNVSHRSHELRQP